MRMMACASLLLCWGVACDSGANPGDSQTDNADSQHPGKLVRSTPWGQYRCVSDPTDGISLKDMPLGACADIWDMGLICNDSDGAFPWVNGTQCYVLCAQGATRARDGDPNQPDIGSLTCGSRVVMRDPGNLALTGFMGHFETDQPTTVTITIEARLADGSVHNEWGSWLTVYYDFLHDASVAGRDDYFSVNATFTAEPGHSYPMAGGFSPRVIASALKLGSKVTCAPPAEFTVTVDCQ
jgi:hypothetical protein